MPPHRSAAPSSWQYRLKREERITQWRLVVQSMWRVACVRIPRFPIGAVWHRAIAEGSAQLLMPPGSDEQLSLPMEEASPLRGEPVVPPLHTNGGVPNPPSRAMHFFLPPVAPRGTDDPNRKHESFPPPRTTRAGNNPVSTLAAPVPSRAPNDPGFCQSAGDGSASGKSTHAMGTHAMDTHAMGTHAMGTHADSVAKTFQAASLRADGAQHWDTFPIVLLDGQRVRAATAAAGRARVRTTMTIAEARSRCAGLRMAVWDDDTIARAVMRASAAFVQASPQVTPATGAPGLWWIGASGLDALGGERALARRLLAIARRWHPGARVGIADSCVAARAATWDRTPARDTAGSTPARDTADRTRDEGIVIVPPGRCAAYLAPAPLGMVPMDDDLRDTLQALGLRTVGAFAALATEDVERRWGATGVAAWRLANGNDRRRPVLARLDAARAVAAELCPSVPTMEPVLFLVRAALDRLVGELVGDGRSAAVVAITLALDDARGAMPNASRPHTVTREVRLSHPLARVIPLLERCRALLDDWTLQAPVCGVTVAVTATAPLHGAQGDLLDPSWRDPAAADAAFARLRATLGIGAIVRPVLRDTHHPERAGEWQRVDEPQVADAIPMPNHGHPLSMIRDAAAGDAAAGDAVTRSPALRQLDPPERAEVRTVEGGPRAIRWRERVIQVARAIGPERLGGDWWDTRYLRDYWRCEDATGANDLVLYRDYATPGDDAWYVHGWYD